MALTIFHLFHKKVKILNGLRDASQTKVFFKALKPVGRFLASRNFFKFHFTTIIRFINYWLVWKGIPPPKSRSNIHGWITG